MTAPVHLSVVVPTYNEAQNIETLILRISKALKGISHEVVVVDDNSPDGTWKIAHALAEKHPINAICRTHERGLASAVVHGMRAARGEFICVMDSDLSHPPEVIPQLLHAAEKEGLDAVVASRYLKGGSVEEWPVIRKIISIGATTLAFPLVAVRDPMSGFFLVRREKLNIDAIDPIGYKILLEVLVKSDLKKVGELAYTFTNRASGKSNLGMKQYVEYVVQLKRLYLYQFTNKKTK